MFYCVALYFSIDDNLTLQENALVVNEGVTILGESMREHLEAINYAEAIDYIKDIAKQNIEISESAIKEIYVLLLHGINRENTGRCRNVPVMISGSTHVRRIQKTWQKILKNLS